MHHNWDSLRFLDLHAYFLHQIREVFFHYFFRYISNFLFFLFSCWRPYETNVGHLKVVPEAVYTILVFLDSFFFFLFCMVPFSSLCSKSLTSFLASSILLLFPCKLFFISISIFYFWLDLLCAAEVLTMFFEHPYNQCSELCIWQIAHLHFL